MGKHIASASASAQPSGLDVDSGKDGTTRRTLAASMVDVLVREIIGGLIAPGTRLDEPGLSRRFGLSRTPVREALHELCARGLAEHIPYRGVQVQALDKAGIERMFEAMSEMEAMCGRLSALRMTMSERVSLIELHEQMVRAAEIDDAVCYSTLNMRFHDLIWAGCHNDEIVRLCEVIRGRIAPFRQYQLNEPGRLLQSCREHAQICDALIAQDGSATQAALKHHMLSAAREIIRHRLQEQTGEKHGT